ncbi:MAG: HlyD family efflux transporter periplasmic adaptor subunit [Pseudomonas sp.]
MTCAESGGSLQVPASGQSSIIAPSTQGGVIVDVLVHEGQRVHKGQVLLKIAEQRNSAALGDTGKIVSDQLAQKMIELQQQIDAQRRIASLKKIDLDGRVDLLQQRVRRLDNQIANQDKRYEAAKAIYETWRSTAAQVISGYQISQQYDTVLEHESQAQSLRDQRLQVLSELAQVKAELAQLPDSTKHQLASLAVQIADVQSAKAENEQTREIVIRAPNDGVVAGLLAHTGQAVTASLTLMAILPENAQLVAELWVPSRAVGLLRVGESVSIEYEAFPAKRYGLQKGKIFEIANSSISASELTSLLGHQEQEAAYRVLVNAPNSALPKMLSSELLKPGMTLSAKVDVESRKLIDWLIRPQQQLSRAPSESSNG